MNYMAITQALRDTEQARLTETLQGDLFKGRLRTRPHRVSKRSSWQERDQTGEPVR